MSSVPASDSSFDSVWSEYLVKVRPYSAKQKKQILQHTINAFQHILNSMPTPRREDQEAVTSSPQTKSMLADVENLIADRMLQTGADKSIFVRFDAKATGIVSEQQFKAVISSLGISLTDDEMEALIGKYDSVGDRSINYGDLWKYLVAQSEQPRTTAQSAYSTAMLNRPHNSGRESASLFRDIPDSLEDRIARGLKAMRETMYQKSSNFHGIFLSLQNGNKQIAVADLIPAQVTKLGFPVGLATEDELREVAMRHSIKTPGFFNYTEFLAFFTGHDSSKDPVPDPTRSLDSPALLNCLVKINNVNLRKFFKDLDQDNDGLISTDELGRGLVETGGLHSAMVESPAFRVYLESFCTKKAGAFGYAEFIKFVNARPLGNSGQINGNPPMSGLAPIRIHEELNPSQMLELLIKHLRSANISVESVFNQFDCDMDGLLDEAEFFQGVSALGFSLTAGQSKTFFDAVDENKNGVIDVQEFAQLVVNPSKNPKLSTRVRHAPGGASSVPMGSYASADEKVDRPMSGRGAPRKENTYDLGLSQSPLSAEEQSQYAEKRGIARTGLGDSKLDLSFPETQELQERLASSPRTGMDGNISPRVRPSTTVREPPGGKSSINFGGDHGAPAPRQAKGAHASRQSDAGLMQFDPTHPVEQIKQRVLPKTALSSIELKDDQTPGTPPRNIQRVLSSPGGVSTVSFDQTDSEVLRSSRRVLQRPGGTNVYLTHEEAQLSPEAVAPHYRDQDSTTITLSFDPNAELDTQRRVRRAGATPNQGTINLNHSSSRVDADLNEPNGLGHITKRHIAGSPVTVALGSDHGSQLLASYKEAPVEVDSALIERLSQAIYAHSQRLRHTFQEWNKNSQSATLSKANFLAGAQNLKIDLNEAQIAALFQRFDGDGDDALTYSEFVRMLASK